MRGSIYKRGDRYSVIVDIGAGEDGKRRQRWYNGFRTRREAQQKLTEILSSLQGGTYVEPSKATVGSYLKGWLDAPRKPNTERTYRSLSKHILEALGPGPLQKLTTQRVNAFYAELFRNGRLGAKSIGYVHVVLHSCLEDAVRENLIPRNPAHGTRRPRVEAEEQRDMGCWTPAQTHTFLSHPDVRDDRSYAGYFLMATTGIRRGELLALRWGDLDRERGRLSIRRNLILKNLGERQNELVFVSPKGNRSRTVKLDAGTLQELQEHRLRQTKERHLLDLPAPRDTDLMFSRLEGEPLRPGNFTVHFQMLARKAGLPVLGPHGLRHTYATLALAAGVPAKIVQERLGHSSIRITLDLYSHVLPETESDAAERVAALIAG